MKSSKRLKALFKRCQKRYENYHCDKYQDLILSGKMRIWDVPLKWRRNPNTASALYITGFRAARGLSLKRYEEDLAAFETELYLYSKTSSHDPVLLNRLQRLYDDRKAEFDYYRRRDFA